MTALTVAGFVLLLPVVAWALLALAGRGIAAVDPEDSL